MKHNGNINSIKRNGKVFFWVMVALPILQFAIFYIAVNFNSILLAFKSYENYTGTVVTKWVAFENFKTIADTWKNGELLKTCVKNSFKYLLLDLFVVMPISVMFAYYVYKKFAFSGVFKILIFAPSVICIMVLVIFFKSFVEDALVQFIYERSGKYIESIFLQKKYAYYPLTVFYLIMGFSGNLLLYINAMSNVSDSVMEAAMIDGAGEFKSFVHIVIPAIYKSCVSLLIIALAAIGSNQAYIHAFYGSKGAPEYTQTLGFRLFNLVATSGSDGDDPTQYPIAAAYGLVVTIIVVPVTMVAKWLLNKYGPSEE